MARTTKKVTTEPTESPLVAVAQGDGVHLPKPVLRETTSIGVSQAHVLADMGVAGRRRRTTAKSAGDSSTKFPHGGDSFEMFCRERGVSPHSRRTAEEWEALLAEFAERPIYGHRRGPDGGNHRPNPAALR